MVNLITILFIAMKHRQYCLIKFMTIVDLMLLRELKTDFEDLRSINFDF